MRNSTATAIGLAILVSSLSVAATPDGLADARRRTPAVQVYERTHDAVVNISGQQVIQTSAWPEWPDAFGFGAAPRQQQVRVLGSGVVIHEDGFIVTNAHVVEGAQQIKVTFSDGQEFGAEVVRAEQDKDLAVLRVKAARKLPTVEMGRSDDLMIGETVIAIGNPYGYSNTLTCGVLSALGRDIRVSDDFWLRGLIQTDAPINPGNSGGPLFNVLGELIGITTAIRPEAQNIGFAIPVDLLVRNLSSMLMPEKLRRVRLGLAMGPLLKQVGTYRGISVQAVTKGSPADEAGLRAGDVIVEIDGRRMAAVIDFYVKMMGKQIGEPIRIGYVRPGDPAAAIKGATLTLADRPLPDGAVLARSLFQMKVSELTLQIARQFGFDGAYPVLIVTDVIQGGAAAEVVEPGDLILQVNQATVRNMNEFSAEMEKISEGDTVQFEILRNSTGLFGHQIQRRYTVSLKAKRHSM
jgi:serine protease Do